MAAAPVTLVPLILFATGLAMLLSALHVRFRDVAPIWGVISQILFFASPISHTIERAAAPCTRPLVPVQPNRDLAQQARHWMIGGTPSTTARMGGRIWLLLTAAVVAGASIFGYRAFNCTAPQIAEAL